MVINYDTEKINALMEDFYNATDINMNLLKADFSYVGGRAHRENNCYCMAVQSTKTGAKGCKCSDERLLKECRRTKKMQMHICHAGLCDVAAPLLYDDVIIGYIIFGEMKADTDFSEFKNYISSLGLDVSEMEKYYADISPFEEHKIQSISNIASMLGKYILFENMLKPDFDKCVQKAVTFINENLSEDLTIRSISQGIHASKSVLYKSFRRCFNCTVGEYINARRVEKSINLLMKTDLSIEEISQKVGFASASYYSKTFKKIKGETPLKYKKRNLQ